MSNLKKICVVGAGRWGKNHIRTLYEMGCLSVIVEPDQNITKELQKKYSDILFLTSIEESFVLGLSGYVIATPAPTHCQIAKQIIEKGFSVLIEKPMALNVPDCEYILSIAKQNDVNVMVGHVLLFHPAIQKIKELINIGRIGKLQYIYSNRLNLGQVRTEEDVFWSFAPHDISILQFLTESFPLEINTMGGAFLQEDIHDSTITFLSYPDNVKAHIYLSWLHPFKEHRIVIIGSDGMISFEDSLEHKPLKLYDKKFIINEHSFEKIDGEIERVEYEKKPPLKEELTYFINNLDKGFKISDGANGLEVIKILSSASEKLKEMYVGQR
tara:strand:+ start:2155 stop:3135 length:981 start_codon:yes stop_codon:yes gene_type:complete